MIVISGCARIGGILFLLSFLAAQGSAEQPQDLTAVLAQMEGDVTVVSKGRSEFGSVRRAAQRQILRKGEGLRLPAGAQVTVICSTETLVSLTGPKDWALDASACARGVPVPESSYRNLTSYAGRILPRNGIQLLELEPRNTDGLTPVLLSPRESAVLEASPRFVWTQVPAAVEYEIEIRGAVETSIKLAAGALDCGPGSGPWRDLVVCAWEPSDRWPPLEPGKPVALKLGSRQSLNGPLHQAREALTLHLLSPSEQSRAQESLSQISKLSLDETSRLLLAAGTYVQHKLYVEAIDSFDRALMGQELSEARLALGDIYLTLGLTSLADREYLQVLAGAPDSPAQAGAVLGRGYVAYLLKRYRDARAHFEHAFEIYSKLGLAEEAAAARAAAERC